MNKIAKRALSKLINKPLVIVVTSKLTPDDKFREKEDYAATVCALHNLVLSFWSDGIGSQWSTGSITRDMETYSILGIDSDKEEIIGFVKCGYPQNIPGKSKRNLSMKLSISWIDSQFYWPCSTTCLAL